MKKIGIVTLTEVNYGNRLQNLAVQLALQNMGYSVETLHNPFNPDYSPTKHKIKSVLKLVLKPSKYRAEVYRERAFNLFDKKWITFSNLWLNNKKHMKPICDRFDYFACGSDQLWNPTSKNYGAINFGMFVDSNRKITMAPSFGVIDFPSNREKEFSEYLNSFLRISVREESGADIVKKLTGRKAQVVIDPTMMIDRNKWEEIAAKPQWLKTEKYVLAYVLGDSYMMSWIQSIADKYSCEVINLMDKTVFDYYTTDPAGFLYLIQHSTLMITDSFHGSVFSIIFDRPFIVMERKDGFVSMNTRLDNLLKIFQLENRRFDKVKESEDYMWHDYSMVDVILEKKRNEAYSFLSDSLSMIDK